MTPPVGTNRKLMWIHQVMRCRRARLVARDTLLDLQWNVELSAHDQRILKFNNKYIVNNFVSNNLKFKYLNSS